MSTDGNAQAPPPEPAAAGPHTLRSFKLERYFARHEFSAPFLLCCSDTQPLQMAELLELADEDSRHRWWGGGERYTLPLTVGAGIGAG